MPILSRPVSSAAMLVERAREVGRAFAVAVARRRGRGASRTTRPRRRGDEASGAAGAPGDAADLQTVVARTEDASPAFIRELLRRAALLATKGTTGALVVADIHLAAALDELTSDDSSLTGKLLGRSSPDT
jgi:hypothetical protein